MCKGLQKQADNELRHDSPEDHDDHADADDHAAVDDLVQADVFLAREFWSFFFIFEKRCCFDIFDHKMS